MSKALTYSSYLRLGELLNLQSPQSIGPDGPEHDELLFIVIHQVYELWFKQILHELDYLNGRLRANDTVHAGQAIRRVRTILKTIVAQVDVLETMTPLEFNSFRGFLESASGFQSVQFRELEFLLGLKRRAMLQHYPNDTPGYEDLELRFDQPTLWDAFLHYLHANGFPIPTDQLERDIHEPIQASADVQAALVQVYRAESTASTICESLIDLDEGLQEWRYRHVKMVERTIGTKSGTGGSSGAAYLTATIKPFFPDLWAIRSQL